tara:strand:+ start:6495 stop:6764 length:270 start_codon:yes stop_codon:yes gene_type:complete
MLRSIKSGQRKVRVLALKVASNTLTGPDKLKASISGLVVTFDVPFAEEPVIIAQSADGTVTVPNKSKTGFEVGEACDVLIIGSDTTEKY